MKDCVRKFMAKHSVQSHIVGFAAFLFLFLFSDRMVWMSDVGKINVNGWISFAHGFVPLFLLALVPLFLLGRYAKYLYLPLFFVEIVLQGAGWFARVNFKMVLDGDLIGIVLGSSPAEMIWFIKHYATVSTFLLLIFLGGLLFGVWKLTNKACGRSHITKTTVAMGVGAILVFFYANRIMDAYVYKRFEQLEKQIFGVNLVMDCFRHWDDFKLLAAMKTSPQIPETIRMRNGDDGNVLGVVVLGESATRNHWGLYGYERDTTPCMSARNDELVVFDNLITPIGSTAESMRYTFTTRTIECQNDLRFTMAQCLKAVGYDVAMFSNQQRWGEWDGDESFDFAGCDPFIFMNEEGETNAYDEVLIPYYTNYLASVKAKTVIFLHLRGSHPPIPGCYPQEGAPFAPETFAHSSERGNPALTKNHYDNSIWYTDKVLERVICELETMHCPAWMIYFSDHGETPSSKSWRTQTDNDLWEIPFIVWTSREFDERYPEKVKALKSAKKLTLQSDQLLYGILTFCGIEGIGNKPSEDFLNPAFVCRKRRMVQGGRVEYVPKDRD